MQRAIACLAILCATACGDSRESIATELYHLPDRPDAVSLEIRPEGTFRWYLSACDSFGGDEGLWQRSDEGFVLLPAAGESSFRWLGFAVRSFERLDVVTDPAEPDITRTLRRPVPV